MKNTGKIFGKRFKESYGKNESVCVYLPKDHIYEVLEMLEEFDQDLIWYSSGLPPVEGFKRHDEGKDVYIFINDFDLQFAHASMVDSRRDLEGYTLFDYNDSEFIIDEEVQERAAKRMSENYESLFG